MSLNQDIASALAWWHEAGVDTIVAESPRDWLRPERPERQPAATPQKAVAEFPGTLDEFRAWLLADDLIPGSPDRRVDAQGNPASDLMIVIDQPEAGDAERRKLLSGEEGGLLDRMLAAIGRDRNSVYLTSMSPARPPAGRLDDALRERLAPAALHHVALAAPRLLLVMGDAAARVFCGTDLAQARERPHQIRHGGGETVAIATFSLRFLLQRPASKADCWKDLQMLTGLMT